MLAVIVSLLLPRVFRSGGFFQLSGLTQRISVPEYKKSNSLFTSPFRFIVFVRENKYFQGGELNRLMRRFSDPDDLQGCISPIFSYSKDDIRETGQGSPEVNYVLGLNLYARNNSQENARRTVHVLGMFIRDCFLYIKLGDYVNFVYNNSMASLRKIENQIIDTNAGLEIQSKKKTELKQILSQYPNAGKFSSREIVSLGNDGHRYLSPATQLVGIESTIVDTKGSLTTFQRDKDKALFNLEIFSGAKKIFERNQFGETAFREIMAFAEDLFKKKDLTRSAVQTVVNQFYIDMETYRTLFFEDMRFLSGPPLPAKVIAPKKRLIVTTIFSGAFIFFLFLALSFEWWKKNRLRIMGI
jgi:hypothetical protein